MKYFLDTEFHEYSKKSWFGKPVDTIELISIGIVAEDGREYYAICKEFNIKAAYKNKWLRENVLFPIWCELFMQDEPIMTPHIGMMDLYWTEKLFKKYGKTKKEISSGIMKFIKNFKYDDHWYEGHRYDSSFGNGVNNTYLIVDDVEHMKPGTGEIIEEVVGTSASEKPKFYAYYADYDWVVFCWLWGRMIDLPEGFPMYCIDLKQIMDTTALQELDDQKNQIKQVINSWERYNDFPKNENEHNALDDAKWNYELYKFLNNVKEKQKEKGK